jgi:RHS repeat-associated protein
LLDPDEPLPLGSSAERALTRDAAGGMANNGQFQLRYDERNRLDRVIVGGLTTSFGVNGLGERTTKDGRPTFGVFEHVYDLSGQLLGIYKSGAPEEEIVWLGALPVGTIQGGAAYHIAPDHLGAPYKIVNSANAQVWFWDHDPFGNGAPTAAAGFWHRLRFPGQVYDSESKLHSNGKRDYDPRLGRYVESDPIGLEGGINTYAYAGNDPVNAVDPSGLDDDQGNEGYGSDFLKYLSNSWKSLARAPSDLIDDPKGVFRAGLEGLAAVGLPAARAMRVVRGGTAAAEGVRAGEAGAFGSLKGVKGDGLTAHHIPQAAAGRTGYNEGGALVMTQAEHALTRTYGSKGIGTLRSDAGLSFRDVLATDIRDVRSIVG